MKPGAYDVVIAATRLYGPLIVLFACMLLALGDAGGGVGFVAGLAFALALALYALVFGAAAAKAAFPPLAARLVLALGVIAAAGASGARAFAYAPQLGEAGLFAVTAAGASLVLTACMGRAPTLRDADW